MHGDRYDYSLVEYSGSHGDITIICPIHGQFEQKAYHHIAGHGCRKCSYDTLGNNRRVNVGDVISGFTKTHGNKYDYSLVKYKNKRSKVTIICPIHGQFEQTPKNHLNGQGCCECGRLSIIKKQSSNTEEFITKAIKIHNNKYDYSLVDYTNNRTKVTIICPIHGQFEQIPNDHLNGSGCVECSSIISKPEKDLLCFIKSIYNDRIVTNTRTVIAPYELDIYLPKPKIAFEYNGNYWHKEGINKPMGYHQMKTDMCYGMGIRLYHIWENDWMIDNKFMKECIKRSLL